MEDNQSSPFEKAVILIAHGSRVQQTADEMDAIIDKLKLSMPKSLILPAFMEIQQPDLKSTMSTALKQGVSKINVVPLFFFTGRHMRDDIPAQVEECRQEYPECEIILQDCFGKTDEFIIALKDSVSAL